VTAARKSTQPGARSRCVFDRLSDRRGHSAFQLRNKYRRREIGEEGTGKKTSSKEAFSIGHLEFDRRNESYSQERPERSENNATYESMKRIIDRTRNWMYEIDEISRIHFFDNIMFLDEYGQLLLDKTSG